MIHPAIALLEVASIAQGLFLCDVLVKKAPVRLLRAEAVSPGKFLVLFGGDVASVEESHQAALDAADGEVVDTLLLPQVHDQVLPALEGCFPAVALDAVGIYEVHTVASGLLAIDAALKAAAVSLVNLRVARGIGGKLYFTVTGTHSEVEAALDAADGPGLATAARVRRVLVPNPHEDFLDVLRPGDAGQGT
ncbi:MAG: BMC domain-containing protein [Candidatus Sericytochromatia bacterium]|nr:BMC domain-containing protein [Candidatus Sericytochromatia bacterium]